MSYSDNPAETSDAVLIRDGGVPFRPLSNKDPILQWMDLMEVVQALCPVWPVRDKPMQGNNWRL